VTALRRLWQHLPVLGLVILACMPVYAVVVAVCQLLINTIIIILLLVHTAQTFFTCCLAVTGGGNIGQFGRLNQTSWLLRAL